MLMHESAGPITHSTCRISLSPCILRSHATTTNFPAHVVECGLQLVRDLCSWCGLRQVSRRTFVRALQEKGSVMLVPGGQAELVHTWRIKCKKEYVVYGKHKGQRLPAVRAASMPRHMTQTCLLVESHPALTLQESNKLCRSLQAHL